jgi:hypothetical protein
MAGRAGSRASRGAAREACDFDRTVHTNKPCRRDLASPNDFFGFLRETRFGRWGEGERGKVKTERLEGCHGRGRIAVLRLQVPEIYPARKA